jgi:hypothetical protein
MEIMTNVFAVGALAVIIVNHRLIEQGWTPPPVEHRHRSGGSPLYAGACLGFLLCRDAGLCFFYWCRVPSPSCAVAVELWE